MDCTKQIQENRNKHKSSIYTYVLMYACVYVWMNSANIYIYHHHKTICMQKNPRVIAVNTIIIFDIISIINLVAVEGLF